ncbi:MAG: TIR domain-containing protein [Methanothrix sp.]|nr:TIR domain-containing protein [Methanothrix sp.]
MKIFISWSGPRSKAMAEALKEWLPNVIQAVDPWVSSSDIDAGMRWTPALAEQLQQTQLGILCLTAENLNAPWLLFEAGALSKIIDKTRVCPYLLGLEPTDVMGPLSQFQAVVAEKDGTKKLLQTINHVQIENALPEDRLNTIFNAFWPSLEQNLTDISNSPAQIKEAKRTLENKVDEILNLVRAQSRELLSTSQPDLLFISDSIDEVKNELSKFAIEVPNDAIESRLKKLIIDFRVPRTEAIRSIINYYLKEEGIELAPEQGGRHKASRK